MDTDRSRPTATTSAGVPAAAAPNWRDAVWLAALWGPLWWRWAAAWNHDPEVAHGWAVPVLAGYLLWQHWRSGGAFRGDGNRRLSRFAPIVMGGGLLGVWLTLPVLEANPMWPRAQWTGGVAAVLATWAWLVWRGGRAALRCGWFPVLFLLTAISWPSLVRAPLVNTLTRWHAELAAEIVTLGGRAAVVRGHIIEVESGLIGVEEACSGLRSLQAVWMFAWFFGELHRLSVRRRVVLVAFAMLAAMAFNVVRTVWLTWLAGAATAGAESWHGPAGIAVMVATLIAIVVAADRLRKAAPAPAEETVIVRPRWRPTPRAALWRVVPIVVGLEIAMIGWYRPKPPGPLAGHWQLATQVTGWEPRPLSADVLATLMCSSADQLRAAQVWNGAPALAMVFRWENDQDGLSTLTNAHDPAVCMPAIGATLTALGEPVAVTLEGRTLIFDAYRFEVNGRNQYVFNAVWDATSGEATPRAVMGGSRESERFARVWRGRRSADRDRIVFVLQDSVSAADAEAWLRRVVPTLLRIRSLDAQH